MFGAPKDILAYRIDTIRELFFLLHARGAPVGTFCSLMTWYKNVYSNLISLGLQEFWGRARPLDFVTLLHSFYACSDPVGSRAEL